jgi:hypothetical protein
MHEVFITTLSLSLSIVGIAGGGGSSGGGGGGGGSYGGGSGGGSGGSSPFATFIAVIIMLAVIGIAVYSSVVAARALKAKRARIKAEIDAAATSDAVWNQTEMVEYAKGIFLQHQKDWTSFDIASMKQYMTVEYLYHTQLMLAALQQMNRQNQVNNIVINSAEIVEVDDEKDNAKDKFDITITATVQDVIFDTMLNQVLHQQQLIATQTYHFVRSGKKWLISHLTQATASQLTYQARLESFAKANKFCYSQDWGWLLLPKRGQLFGTGKFGTSDINNHIIGMYKGVLIQLYTYIPLPGATKSYIIAQTAVPKTYGNIVVRRKKTTIQLGIKGLSRLKTEWEDFNKKYDIYASDAEQATSFELLNPKFMEQLEALPFEVSIEVVDNVVYLYANESDGASINTATDSRYVMMLEVLKAAFKEMRM